MEPLGREVGNVFQRSRFFEEMRRARNDFEFLDRCRRQLRKGLPVQIQNVGVISADDEQSGRVDL